MSSHVLTLEKISLPKPEDQGGMSLHEALAHRRSKRDFIDRTLTREQISQLCWAGQGITSEEGHRTAPSAGAIYGITLYLVDRNGAYRYQPNSHSLIPEVEGQFLPKLQTAALNQDCVGSASICFVIAINVGRMASKYGSGAERYCLLEAGHVAQNILLEATALHLGAVPVGAINEQQVVTLLNLPKHLKPVYVLPVGHSAE